MEMSLWGYLISVSPFSVKCLEVKFIGQWIGMNTSQGTARKEPHRHLNLVSIMRSWTWKQMLSLVENLGVL